MQNTRWLTRNTLRCWWWWYDGGGSKKEEERQRAKIISSLRRREENDVLREEEGLSIILRLFCGQMRLSRGDCLARWWWWWCFLSFVSLMSDARFWKIKSISLNSSSSLLPLTTKKKNKNKTMKRRRTFIRLAYHSKHNTIWPCVCVCINYIIMRGNII